MIVEYCILPPCFKDTTDIRVQRGCVSQLYLSAFIYLIYIISFSVFHCRHGPVGVCRNGIVYTGQFYADSNS